MADDPIDMDDVVLEEIDIQTTELTLASKLSVSTDGKFTVSGSGVFDDLMEAVNVHLKAQFDTGRISGTDYAGVYTTALTNTIQQAVAFLLGKYNAQAQYNLIMAQIEAQKAQILKILAEIELINAQILSEAAKLLLIEAQIANMQADTEIKREQSAADLVLKDAQTQKVMKEVQILEQKRVTEVAQTEGVSIEDEGGTGTLGGILGQQAQLYNQQAKAFKWNANQKHLKTLLDAWSMNVNTSGIADIGVSALQPNGVDVNGCPSNDANIDSGMNEWIHNMNPDKVAEYDGTDRPYVNPGPDPCDPSDPGTT